MKKCYCFFTAQYLPSIGGVENYTYNLAKELVNLGQSVIIVTSHEKDLPFYEVQDKIKIYRLPTKKLINDRLPILIPTLKTKKMLTRLVGEKIDQIIIQTRIYPLSLLGASFSFRNKIPGLVIDHSSGYLSFGNSFYDIFARIYEKVFTKVIKSYISDFYGVSGRASGWLKKFDIVAKGELYNAISPLNIEEEIKKSKIDFRKEYNIPDGGKIICYVGRLVSGKGGLKTVKAFNLLNQNNEFDNSKTYLFIAGDGDEFQEIKRIKSKNVILLGKIPHPDVLKLMMESDVFVFPSTYPEGLPTTLLESGYLGCTPVVTDAGGMKEVICQDSLGIVLEDAKIETIKEGLIKALKKKDYSNLTDDSLKNRILENYTWKIIANKILDIKGDQL
ncbi:MAG: glycosyltransferase family 4 protein [Lachnospiraceae bacterium]|nr:glycosyltransferase family 4 protein [Lachnospiraceae bacterium]